MQYVLKFLTRLPLPVLYALGRFAYVVAYHVMRWHRELAARNLANAFPEKSEAERAALLKQSYVNLGETLAETFWGFGASAEALAQRVAIENPEVIRKYITAKVPVVVLTAHVCNWEWLLPGTAAQFGIPIDAVYKPLRVASLDAFIRDTRSRFGGKPIPIQSFLFELMRRAGEARAYAMVADQTPPRNMDKYWTQIPQSGHGIFHRCRQDRALSRRTGDLHRDATRQQGSLQRARACARRAAVRIWRRSAGRRALCEAPRARGAGESGGLAVGAQQMEVPEARRERRRAQTPPGEASRVTTSACVLSARAL